MFSLQLRTTSTLVPIYSAKLWNSFQILYDNTLTVYTRAFGYVVWEEYSRNIQHINSDEVAITTLRTRAYLNLDRRRITIPKYFVKIVGYSVPFIISDEKANRPQYYIAIVIHNEKFQHSGRLCNTKNYPICEKNGWHVTPDEGDDTMVYCCQITDFGLKLLVEEYQLKGEVFNLRQVVMYKNGDLKTEIDVAELLKGETNMTEELESDNSTQTEMLLSAL